MPLVFGLSWLELPRIFLWWFFIGRPQTRLRFITHARRLETHLKECKPSRFSDELCCCAHSQIGMSSISLAQYHLWERSHQQSSKTKIGVKEILRKYESLKPIKPSNAREVPTGHQKRIKIPFSNWRELAWNEPLKILLEIEEKKSFLLIFSPLEPDFIGF